METIVAPSSAPSIVEASILRAIYQPAYSRKLELNPVYPVTQFISPVTAFYADIEILDCKSANVFPNKSTSAKSLSEADRDIRGLKHLL